MTPTRVAIGGFWIRLATTPHPAGTAPSTNRTPTMPDVPAPTPSTSAARHEAPDAVVERVTTEVRMLMMASGGGVTLEQVERFSPPTAARLVAIVRAGEAARYGQALRELLMELDYDLYKAYACDEETGKDEFPALAAKFARLVEGPGRVSADA